MQRDLDRLEDILAAAGDIIAFTEGLDLREFQNGKSIRYAILHALTIIGEAANQISPELRARHRHIPWRRIIDFRHRVVHGYAVLDTVLVWEIATRMAPDLRQQMQEVLAAEFPQESHGPQE